MFSRRDRKDLREEGVCVVELIFFLHGSGLVFEGAPFLWLVKGKSGGQPRFLFYFWWGGGVPKKEAPNLGVPLEISICHKVASRDTQRITASCGAFSFKVLAPGILWKFTC